MPGSFVVFPLNSRNVCYCFRWLEDRNVDTEKLLSEKPVGTSISESGGNVYPSANNALETIPHEDESNWFIKCSRNEAEQLLKDKDEGTFLVRPSRQEGSFALSIV